MSWRVELSKEEKLALAELKAKPFKVDFLGRCIGCGKGIPQGYVPIVTRHASVTLAGGVKSLHPIDSWCKDCGTDAHKRGILPKYKVDIMTYAEYRRSLDIQLLRVLPDVAEIPIEKEIAVQQMDPKALAKKMLGVMSKTEGYGSKKIAKLADIEYSDTVKAILQKLASANIVIFDEGRWRRS